MRATAAPSQPPKWGRTCARILGDFVYGGLHYFFADSVTFTGAAMSRACSCTALVHAPASAAPPPRLLQSDPM